jgi:predicted RNA-binding Zn-ribbon protein involved in translation (DUF1610 family)
MDKPTWGCPECGATDIVQHVKLDATREGTFRPDGNGWAFECNDEYDRESVEVSDEGEFECSSCGEAFERPSRVRQGTGIRLALKVSGAAFLPDENGVEQAMDDDFSSRFEVACADKEQVTRLFETLRLFLKGVSDAARGARETG